MVNDATQPATQAASPALGSAAATATDPSMVAERDLLDSGGASQHITSRPRHLVLSLTLLLLTVAGTIGPLLPFLDREVKGAIALVLMLVLIAGNVPVGIAIIWSALIGIFGVAGWNSVESSLLTATYRPVTSWSLAVLPMFILMGLLLWRAGATERLYVAADAWFGRVPGGLAVTTNFAGAGLATVSGSTIGITYAIARIGVPEMLRAGYDRRMATGAVLVAGTGGQLIPPSLYLVIYAGIAGTAVGPQLMAGLVPGVVLAVLYALIIMGIAMARPELAPRRPSAGLSFGQVVRVTVRVWPLPVLGTVVLGGLFLGVFTATEAGAVGALGAALITLGYVGVTQSWSRIWAALGETLSATASIMLLIVGAALLSQMLSLSGVARWLTATLDGLEVSTLQFLLILAVCYLLIGLVIDPLTMMLLTVPLILPLAEAVGVSPLWFGVFVVLLGELAVVTPPVGILTFVVHRVVQDPEVRGETEITLADVFTGVLWFLPAALAVLVLLILFPQLAEWLPSVAN